MNDILLKMNLQHVTLLVILDLSAAFDTLNQKILLERLHHDTGISRIPLQWFKSYFSTRRQKIEVQGTLSLSNFNLECGVPQGSCLVPLLYIIYASKLFKIIEHHLSCTLLRWRYSVVSQLQTSGWIVISDWCHSSNGKMYWGHKALDD